MAAIRNLTFLALISASTTLLAQTDTYSLIQERIFNRYCVGCHQPGTAFARQSGLVLIPDSSYDHLVNVAPRNRAAREDGLLRVSPDGLAGLYKSFLWEKINAPSRSIFTPITPIMAPSCRWVDRR